MIALILNDAAKQRSVLVVVIEQDNLERMKTADPITLLSRKQGGILPAIIYPDNFECLIAYELESGELYSLIDQGDSAALIEWLARGYRYKKSDGDGIYTSVQMDKKKKEIDPDA
jgi:hypothetical protein